MLSQLNVNLNLAGPTPHCSPPLPLVPPNQTQSRVPAEHQILPHRCIIVGMLVLSSFVSSACACWVHPIPGLYCAIMGCIVHPWIVLYNHDCIGPANCSPHGAAYQLHALHSEHPCFHAFIRYRVVHRKASERP